MGNGWSKIAWHGNITGDDWNISLKNETGTFYSNEWTNPTGIFFFRTVLGKYGTTPNDVYGDTMLILNGFDLEPTYSFLGEVERIIALPVANITISVDYCLDSNTLADIDFITINGVEHNFTYYRYCEYGCDNSTFICNPAQYVQNIYDIGIGAIFLVIIILIYKFSRRRRRR